MSIDILFWFQSSSSFILFFRFIRVSFGLNRSNDLNYDSFSNNLIIPFGVNEWITCVSLTLCLPSPISVINKPIEEDRFDIPEIPMEED